MEKKAVVVGSGFAGLSAAAFLAKAGFKTTILEKNAQPGGRARKFEKDGFVFDMGPSWYWMPDVFDRFYREFGHTTSDFYDLVRLDPSYQVVFSNTEKYQLPANIHRLYALFESIEKGSSENLKHFLDEAEFKYEVGIKELVYKPGRSLKEFADARLLKGILQMDVFKSVSSQVHKLFKHPHLREILEFPVLFLGAKPDKIPALYSLMNYADMVLGTWYPMGGMNKIVESFLHIAKEQGVEIIPNCEVTQIKTEGKVACGVDSTQGYFEADVIVSGADYYHTDKALIPEKLSNYSESYWDKRVMAPSSLIFYLGVDKKIDGLDHHNLFFDQDFNIHAKEIYEDPKWPSNPLFYVCAPSKTDPSVAPEGCENLFILIPVAPGLSSDDETTREKYYTQIMDRLESLTGQSIRDHVIYKRSYAQRDFQKDYHAFKGNAYGLANTLSQTALLKPSLKNKNINNLYYTGQLTVPGPGVPPAIISGEVVAKEVVADLKH